MKRAAVIGVGALGRHHARIYSELPQVELVAVADIDAERGREVAQQCGCRFVRDFREVISGLDAVSLAVPTEKHAAIACDCLERGVDVLVEKPIASSLSEAERMLESQVRGNARLHVGHSERFNPALTAAWPHIGRPGFFEVHRMGSFVPRSLDIDVVLDLMIHDIDLILHLVDDEVAEVRAAGVTVLSDKIDIANARLQFANGCVANLTASRISLEQVRKIRFFQPHDYVSIDLLKKQVGMFSLKMGDSGPQVVPRVIEIDQTEPLRVEIEAFLEDGPRACTGEQARRALELAVRIKDDIHQTQRHLLGNPTPSLGAEATKEGE